MFAAAFASVKPGPRSPYPHASRDPSNVSLPQATASGPGRLAAANSAVRITRSRQLRGQRKRD